MGKNFCYTVVIQLFSQAALPNPPMADTIAERLLMMKDSNMSNVLPPTSRGPHRGRQRCLLVGQAPMLDPVALGGWLQSRFPDLEFESVGSADELERALTTGPVGLVIAGLPLPWGDPADATRILAVLRNLRMPPSVATRVPLILLPTGGVHPERL